MKRGLNLIIILFSIIHLYSQNPEFYHENIDFEIKGQYFYVKGDYYFSNSTKDSIKTILTYPFPSDKEYGEVDSVEVFNLSDLKNTNYKIGKAAASFAIKLGPYSAKKYRISYRHKLLGNKAEYILLTTKHWHKAFERADYRLFVPENMKIDSISYKPDSTYVRNNKQVYVWHKSNFMPDKNFYVYYKNQ
jgi:hypothetical protein